jgi:MerR family transcriptional regulator, light-induced transcriptional regulator
MKNNESKQRQSAQVATYRSGTAARLAGIPVATLRVWERRYDVIGPSTRPSGHRRYSAGDVSRLALVKALVDAGHPIGALAHLPTEELRALHGTPAALFPAATPARIALVGDSLAAQAAGSSTAALGIVAACAARDAADEALRGISADLLAVELPALREDEATWIESLAAKVGATRVVVGYRFGTQAAVAILRARGYVVIRAPLDLSELALLASLASTGVAPQPIARVLPPRFDEVTLTAFGASATSMYCECPSHVVELLRSVSAFERYSAECTNRSPADAELHRYLERVAGTVRTLLEEALERVARAEGLPLLPAPVTGRG